MPTSCNRGQRLRDGVCCWSTTCSDQGFKACTDNNSTDVCSPCPHNYFIKGKYSTELFDVSPCAEKPECLQEQIRNEEGMCECDRSLQYINNENGHCKLVHRTCHIAGIELDENGECTQCKHGYYKDTNTNAVCKKKKTLTCADNQMMFEGNTTTDRQCVTIQLSNPVTTNLHIGSTTFQSTGNDGQNTGLIYGLSFVFGGLFLLVLLTVVCITMRSRKGSGVGNRKAVRDENAKECVEHNEREGLTKTDESDDVESGLDTMEEGPLSYESGKYTTKNRPEAFPFSDDELRPRQPESADDEYPRLHQIAGVSSNRSTVVAVVRPIVHPSEQTTHLVASPVTDDNGRLLNGPNSIPMPPRNEDDLPPGQGPHDAGNGTLPGPGQHYANNGTQPGHGPHHIGDSGPLNLNINAQGVDVVDDLSSGPYSTIRPSL